MSSYLHDENNETCGDYLEPVASTHSQIDSGYFTFNSPCRLSPSHVVYSQFDSPQSEGDLQSPVNRLTQKFVSTMDYENYVSTRKYFDILTQLNHRDATHLLDQICRYLSKRDFLCCLLVCKKWNLICQDYTRRKQTKSVKRNLFEETSQHPAKKLTSTPMQMITNHVLEKSIIPIALESEENRPPQQEENVHLTASAMTFRYGYLKYLHGPTITKRCPICSFVSIVDVNDQHGICTNPLCRNSFCQCCSGPYHPSSPCKITTGPIKSPWRKRPSISPIFSNKTRNNLRRLLMP